MKLVIPISFRDIALVRETLPLLLRFGPYPKHSLAVTATPESFAEAEKITAQLAPLFARSICWRVPGLTEAGWPKTPNLYFARVMNALWSTRNTEAVYWFEPDNTPTRKGWLEQINEEYLISGKPYLGAVRPCFFNNSAGVRTRSGVFMTGTGVYPADFYPKCKLHLAKCGELPWDVALRNVIVPECHHTALIQDNWQSNNYRRGRGKSIVCGAAHEHGVAEPIRKDAVVVHGCKDGSLARLLALTTPTHL
jgi:hypothetical protein